MDWPLLDSMQTMTEEFRIGTAEQQHGAFVRQQSRFRDWVTADGSSGFVPEAGRYHLYVSRACPWAHRTIIGRLLMGLENAISISFVDPIRDERGWGFTVPGRYEDPVNGFAFLSDAYLVSDPAFSDRVTVPVLWDKQRRTIVNNESPEILRMLSTVFAPLASHPIELYPTALAAEIDELNDHIYESVNNGVYRAGFSTNQRVYESAVRPYLRNLYQWPGIEETVSFDEIRAHYYRTHSRLNPQHIVAVMPALDFDAPHQRHSL